MCQRVSWVHVWACYQALGTRLTCWEAWAGLVWLLPSWREARSREAQFGWQVGKGVIGGWASLRQRAPEKSQVTWIREPGRKRVHLWLPDVRPPEQGAWPSLLCGPLDPRGNPGDLEQENDLPVGGKWIEEEAKREPERWIRRLEPSPGNEMR